VDRPKQVVEQLGARFAAATTLIEQQQIARQRFDQLLSLGQKLITRVIVAAQRTLCSPW
jgi:hypothetical protein